MENLKVNRKEQLIEKLVNEPFKVGESVVIPGNFIGNRSSFEVHVIITEIDGDKVTVKEDRGYSSVNTVDISHIKKETYNVGFNPIVKQTYRLDTCNYSLESIVHLCGLERRGRTVRTKDALNDVLVNHINWNPYVIQVDGSKFYYQRDFCWTLEDKRLFLESIYNNISCGRVILRERGYKWNQEQVELGNTELGWYDIVDGKQRLNCIIEFLQDKFTDSNGYYFSEFSRAAEHKFLDHQLLGFASLDENASDKDVIKCFLQTNFAGVQMSKEHLQYVREIKF